MITEFGIWKASAANLNCNLDQPMFEVICFTYVLYWIYSKVVNLDQFLYFVCTLNRRKAQKLLKVILSDVLMHIHWSLDA